MIKKLFIFFTICVFCVSCTSSSVIYDNIPLTQETLTFVTESNKYLDLVYQAKKLGNDIPILEVYLDDGVAKPLLIFLHGANGNKESLLYLQTEFANKGFYTISVDLQSHGERSDKTSTFTEIILNTGRDLDQVIKYAKSNSTILSKRFGLIGFSMGGMITHWYTTHGNYTPTIIAPIAATADWLDFSTNPLVDYTYKDGKTDNSKNFHEIEVSKLLKNNPLKSLDKYEHTVVILSHGARDDLISANPDREFYQSLKDKNHIRVEYHEYEEVGHTIPNDFIAVLYDRFIQVLITNK